MGVMLEASRTAPTRTERSRRFQGARCRYSRRTWSGSAWGAPDMRSAVAELLAVPAQHRRNPPGHLGQVERLANQRAGIVLQPGADFFGLGVAGHDGDASLQLGPPRLDREVERQAGHRGEVDVEQQGVRLLAAEEVVG